jgi:hypothetical protein
MIKLRIGVEFKKMTYHKNWPTIAGLLKFVIKLLKGYSQYVIGGKFCRTPTYKLRLYWELNERYLAQTTEIPGRRIYHPFKTNSKSASQMISLTANRLYTFLVLQSVWRKILTRWRFTCSKGNYEKVNTVQWKQKWGKKLTSVAP